MSWLDHTLSGSVVDRAVTVGLRDLLLARDSTIGRNRVFVGADVQP